MRAPIARSKRLLASFAIALGVPLASAPVLAADSGPSVTGEGLHVGAFLSGFIAGDAGPVTLVSETGYADTFDAGGGLRLEWYRDYDNRWRAQVGLVYSAWGGRYFAGGEFPAGAQFGDFSLAGIYIGGRLHFGGDERYQPYVVGNLGLVYLSSVSVQTGGTTMSYWTGNWRDYLELGAGVARRTGEGALTVDVRMQVFGKPEPATWLASATAGTALMLAIGYEWERRR